MTEEEAREWIRRRHGPTGISTLDTYQTLILAEAKRQNLIAASTIPQIWARHFVDSAQLLPHAPDGWRTWWDIGSGAGLPGIVIAALTSRSVHLVEPRRLRADFLRHCADTMNVNATVHQCRSDALPPTLTADIISARAVAPIDRLLESTSSVRTEHTRYLLQKGRTVQSELAAARKSWHGAFHVEHSVVDPESVIVIATGVTRR